MYPYYRTGLTVEPGMPGYGSTEYQTPGYGGGGAAMPVSPSGQPGVMQYGGGYVPPGYGGGGAVMPPSPIQTQVQYGQPVMPAQPQPGLRHYGGSVISTPGGGGGAAAPPAPPPGLRQYGGSVISTPGGGGVASPPDPIMPAGVRQYGGSVISIPGGGGVAAPPGSQPGVRQYGGSVVSPGGAAAAAAARRAGVRQYGGGAISPAGGGPAPGLKHYGGGGGPFDGVPLPQPVYGPYGWGNPFFQDCTPEVAFGACAGGCMSIGAMSETGTIITTGITQANAQKTLSDEDGQGIYKAARDTNGGKKSWWLDLGIAAGVGVLGGYLLGKAF